ncbi:ATPase [Aphelenchoides avenae]|nr:ATPase [Aphelenchus avenae]
MCCSLEDKPPGECFKRFEQEVENILNRLMSAGICKISADPDTPPLDDLISYSAVVRVRKEQLHFDLRNFLYVSVVIPHVLSAWPVARIRRNTLLLVGDTGSGKSTWAAAVAQKCASPRIVVSKKQFMRKFMGRKRIYSSIAQFVEGDKYATVVFEQMEIFSSKRSDKKSALKELIRDLLIQVVQDGHCQVIGLSKTEELEQSVLDLLNISMHIKRPNMIERYELIADNLSRRMEEDRLQRVPRRLLEISKTTKTMNCGQTVKKINQKFVRR